MREITEDGREIFVYCGSSVCLVCKHYISDGTCKAFDEIPDEIYYGGSHHKKLPSQKNDIVFEIVDEFKKYYDKFYDKDGNRIVDKDDNKILKEEYINAK